MKIKKMMSKGILGVMTLMMITSTGIIAQADSNWRDKEFNGYYSGYNYVETGWEAKTDYTSAYINNYGSSCGVYVDVYGADLRPCRCEEWPVVRSGLCNYNSAQSVLVAKGQQKKLLNSVKENGYGYAELRMTGTQKGVNLSGKWSPDSI